MERQRAVAATFPHNDAGNNKIMTLRHFSLGLILVSALCLSGCVVSPNLTNGGVDFGLSASPGSQSVTQGQTVGFSINVSQKSGLGPIVQLSASGLPAGALASFSDQGDIAAPGSATLNILTTSATPAGASQVTIIGSDPSGTQKITVMLTVNAAPPPPDFNLTATPATQTALAGNMVNYTVNVSAKGSPTVSLSVSGAPAGATASFDHSSITGTGSAQLMVSTPNSESPGQFPLTITGTDSSGTENVQVSLNIVPTDFSLGESVGAVVINAGGTITGTVTVSPAVGTPGTVTLSSGAPTGVGVGFNPANLPGANGSSTVTITTDTTLTPSDYTVTITASDSSGSQSAQIPLTVAPSSPAAGFFLAASPPNLMVNAGDTAIYNLTLSTSGGPLPTVSFDVQGLPSDAGFQVAQSGPGAFVLNILTDPNSDTTSFGFVVTATGTGGSQSLTLELQVNAISN